MKTYTLLRRVTHVDNTRETGYGDFPRETWKPVITMAATSRQSALSRFRKQFGSHIKISGKSPTYTIQENTP